MVIGFTQRTMTVSESDAADGIELFAINISVAIQRTSERDQYKLEMTLDLRKKSALHYVYPQWILIAGNCLVAIQVVTITCVKLQSALQIMMVGL